MTSSSADRGKVLVNVGPGPHGAMLVADLERGGFHVREVRSWPGFQVREGGRVLWTGRSRDRLRHLAWALWRRLPVLGPSERPRTWFAAVQDRIAAEHLADVNVAVVWSQVSLRTLQASREMGIPTVLVHHMVHADTWVELTSGEYDRWAPRSARLHSRLPATLVGRMLAECDASDVIAVPSSFVRESFLRAGTSPERLVEVHPCVDTRLFHPGNPAHRDPAGPFRLLYAGRLEIPKGIPYLLQAFERLSGLDAELHLVGQILPETEALLARSRTGGLVVRGPVPEEGMPDVYRDMDALVFPSVYDAFGLVVVEAMACGLPVITTTHSLGADAVEDGIQGFVVPPRDPDALSTAMESLARDPERSREMGLAGRARAMERYSVDVAGDQASRLVALLCGGGRGE